MNSQQLQQLNLPDTPGIYQFLSKKNAAGKRDILYIGKATSLKDRVKSYFSSDLINTRGAFIVDMVEKAETVEAISTHSVLEALLLEAALIKKHQPHFNTLVKDDKSFNYVAITEDDFPIITTVRGKNLESYPEKNIKYLFGPFPHGTQLREALKIIRRMFPYRDEKCKPGQGRPCFNREIGLCPGVCTGEISKADYARRINHIRLFFEGKKQELMKSLEKDMRHYASTKEFEQANEIKKTIFALDHIQDVALMKREKSRAVESSAFSGTSAQNNFRIEAYDVAHLSGASHVGVMVVIEDGEPAKSEYRKFKIKTQRGANDVGALREILKRRFTHSEWPVPALIVIDGGEAQLNAAKQTLEENPALSSIPIVSVVKDRSHKPKDVLGNEAYSKADSPVRSSILLANSEAHRFAIAYHRQMRGTLFGR